VLGLIVGIIMFLAVLYALDHGLLYKLTGWPGDVD
jgi:hypothetical protein